MQNDFLDEIIKGLQERSRDIFYDFHEFGDVDEDDNPVDPASDNATPGRYQSAIEKFCVAAEQAEEILQALKARPYLAGELFKEKNASPVTEQNRGLARGEFECTPGPWTVESHPDTEGAYIIKEARYEQQVWGPDGYDVSDAEGDRRDLLVERRDAGNIRLIQAAPELFHALGNLLQNPETGKAQSIEILRSIGPNWPAFNQKERRKV
ncbi:MAG: hypothetical protein M8357_16310 [Desulfobulbaceae bacterium]|nr:hypothetical protein [Desulfobulbaceae bacterium]